MEAVELREALAAFLGEERFRKFVAAGLRRGRLRFWQEQEWRRFCSARPEFAAGGVDALEVALRICHVHGEELRPDTVELFHGCRDFSLDHIDARNRLFPHAASGPVSTEGATVQGDRAAVWYCPACRLAEARWQAHRTEQPSPFGKIVLRDRARTSSPTDDLLQLETPGDPRIARPFKTGLRNGLFAIALIGVGGLGYLYRFSKLHKFTVWWVWGAVAVGAVAVCFGHSYLGSRVSTRTADNIGKLILLGCLTALILWMKHVVDAGR